MSSISEKRLWELWTFIATQKSASSWLTVLPIRDMEFDLNQSESFGMLWNLGTTGKFLIPPLFVSAGDIVAGGFWERQSLDFFSVRGCHPKADSYRDMSPDQIFRQHATENKRQYASRVLEVEQATFTPLVFSTIGRMAMECKWYHSRLAALTATKKGESYTTTMSWIRAKVSIAGLRSAFLFKRLASVSRGSFTTVGDGFRYWKTTSKYSLRHWERYFISPFV